MSLIRKIDLYGQLILGFLTALVLAADVLLSLVGLFLLGVWQVISALLNSFQIANTVNAKKILIYWILAIAAIALMAVFDIDSEVSTVTLFACYGIAVYYWFILRSHYRFLDYRKELATIVRH